MVWASVISTPLREDAQACINHCERSAQLL
jgi:hypothetical protein